MDEEIERLLVSVRADTAVFARDVAAMRAELDGPFAAGAERAGRVLENALVRARMPTTAPPWPRSRPKCEPPRVRCSTSSRSCSTNRTCRGLPPSGCVR